MLKMDILVEILDGLDVVIGIGGRRLQSDVRASHRHQLDPPDTVPNTCLVLHLSARIIMTKDI